MNRLKELIDSYRYHIMGISAALISLLIIGLIVQNGDKTTSGQPNTFDQSVVSTSMANEASEISGSSKFNDQNGSDNGSKLVVDIKGGVKSPGVYQMVIDQRVADLVEAAGGFSSMADRKNVNLARKLTDQQVVYIPIKGEIKENLHLNNARDDQSIVAAADNSISNSTGNDDKININTADKQQLQSISGIGEKKAENIVSYRQQHGNFKSIDEIKNTDGIGDKMFENIKNQITI
ncbi:helix-hairpin-helix domain-containing protein [Lactobacillaceae bacterium Scapto_B20]